MVTRHIMVLHYVCTYTLYSGNWFNKYFFDSIPIFSYMGIVRFCSSLKQWKIFNNLIFVLSLIIWQCVCMYVYTEVRFFSNICSKSIVFLYLKQLQRTARQECWNVKNKCPCVWKLLRPALQECARISFLFKAFNWWKRSFGAGYDSFIANKNIFIDLCLPILNLKF